MPLRNNFRHQTYTADPPPLAPEFLTLPPAPADQEELRERMKCVGRCYADAGVRAVYLVHGTFMGTDALGMARMIDYLAPFGADWARRLSKSLVDAIARDQANFTETYAREMEDALRPDGVAIPVRLFHWSSQNHHVGRADAAMRLLDELVSQKYDGGRILLWGHSHGGNVFALLTNILGADPQSRQRFFESLVPYYGTRGPAAEMLARIASLLEDAAGERPPGCLPLSHAALDMVTFGAPIRYGWDAAGFAKLLHFVYHRPSPRCAAHLAVFPFRIDDVVTAAGGDYIQQVGIAGTNLAPHLFAVNTWRSELGLTRLLQPDIRRRDLLAHLAIGMRVPHEGQTLVVDYGAQGINVTRHIAGHAVYTRREQMLFHAEEVARRFYGMDEQVS